MIQPNFDLMLWVIFVSWSLKSICAIILGASGMEKETKYSAWDIAAGVISLIIVLIVALC